MKDEVYLENEDLVLRKRRRESVWHESRVYTTLHWHLGAISDNHIKKGLQKCHK
jgi:hypothetical protein